MDTQASGKHERESAGAVAVGVFYGALCLLSLLLLAVFYYYRPQFEHPAWPWARTPRWMLDLSRAGFSFPWDVVAALGLLAWYAVALSLTGGALLRWRFPRWSSGEALVWGGGLALGVQAYLIFFIGIVGLLDWAVGLFSVLGMGWTLAALWLSPKLLRLVESVVECESLLLRSEAGEAAPVAKPSWRVFSVFVWLGVVLLQVVALAYALSPAVQSDGLRYHLAAPQEWLKAGGLVYLPYNAFSNFPFLVEMLFLQGLALQGDLLAKGFHWVFLPLSAGAVGLLAVELRGRGEDGEGGALPVAALAALAWTSLQAVLPLAGWAFIDLAVCFYLFGMIYFLLRWQRGDGREGGAAPWLAAVFGGLLVASKYTGVLQVFLGAVLMVVFEMLGRRGEGWRPWLRALCFGLLAAAIGAPWWLKNVVHTGNPVYPLAWGLFGGGEWTALAREIYGEKLGQKGFGRGAVDFLLLPWRTALVPERFGYFYIGPLFLVFVPWLLVFVGRARQNGVRRMAGAWLLLLVLSWFLTYQSNRFLLPFCGLAIAAVLSVAGDLWRTGHRLLARCLVGLFLLCVLLSGAGSLRWTLFEAGPWPAFLLGKLDRGDYLSRQLAYYPAADWANRSLGDSDKVLLIGEHRKFHWEVSVRGNDWYDPPLFMPYLAEAADADAMLDRLRAEGFTHIFFNLDEYGWPEDARVQLAREASAATAWPYNRRYFPDKGAILRFRELLASDRLVAVQVTRPGRIFLAEIR